MPNRDYTDFDKFIKGKIKNGTLYFDMPYTEMVETLKGLGIRRVKYFDDENKRYYIVNAYPKDKQTRHVQEVLEREKTVQRRIDKTDLYRKEGYRFRVKKGKKIVFNNRVYRGGNFLPHNYIYE